MRVNGAAVARAVCVYSLRYLRSCVRLFVSPQLWRLCSVCVGRLASSWPRRHAACNAPEIGLRVSHSPDVSAMGACASAARRTTGRPHAPTRRLASLERRRLARACPGILTRGRPPPPSVWGAPHATSSPQPCPSCASSLEPRGTVVCKTMYCLPSVAARHTQGTHAHPPIPLEWPGSTLRASFHSLRYTGGETRASYAYMAARPRESLL
jgi:hypothetical protein